MIGDSITDIDCAKNAGIPVILVSYGYLNTNLNKIKVDKIINNLAQLPNVIQSLQ